MVVDREKLEELIWKLPERYPFPRIVEALMPWRKDVEQILRDLYTLEEEDKASLSKKIKDIERQLSEIRKLSEEIKDIKERLSRLEELGSHFHPPLEP